MEKNLIASLLVLASEENTIGGMSKMMFGLGGAHRN